LRSFVDAARPVRRTLCLQLDICQWITAQIPHQADRLATRAPVLDDVDHHGDFLAVLPDDVLLGLCRPEYFAKRRLASCTCRCTAASGLD
jgi:hypothetical protein